MTLCWGWIPTLDPSIDAQPIPERVLIADKPSVDAPSIENATSAGCRIRTDNITYDVHIIDNFITFEHPGDHATAQTIYRVSKGAYHLNVTHSPETGLDFVVADDVPDAVEKFLSQFELSISQCRFAGSYRISLSSSEIMNLLGMLDYGLAFIDRYEHMLSDERCGAFREMLHTHRMYLDEKRNAQYSAHVDEQRDRSMKLTMSSLNTSYIMLVLAVSGIIYNICNTINEGTTVGANPVFLATQAALAVPLVIIALRHMRL